MVARVDDPSSHPGEQVRAAGRRIRYGDVPSSVREQIARRHGEHEVLHEHIGGMSPGCATSVRSTTGGTLFVKAVGSELNEGTVALLN